MTPTGIAKAAHVSSFRDPSGTVLIADGRIFRTIEQFAQADFQKVQSSGILDKLASSGWVVATWPIQWMDAPAGLADGLISDDRQLVEHQRIPVISYPYEWPFALLKRAALHYLDLYLELLKSDFTLSDASAYNVQFLGVKPIYIDILSIRPYKEGEYWAGYRQFCEQFLNPLLLTAKNGIPHQSWFRGSSEGIPLQDMAKILPLGAKFSWQIHLHVLFHARLVSKGVGVQSLTGSKGVPAKPMPKTTLTWFVKSLRTWISGLKSRGFSKTVWQDYEHHTSYSQLETDAKRSFVTAYIENRQPKELLDLGCNTGSYSQLALDAGVERVVGIDFDQGAINAAVDRADAKKLNLLPLIIDSVNPSPSQGWNQEEWLGFKDRINADGLLALALLHHIVIGRNIPMTKAVAWLAALAPSGVIEFVPKGDPMVQRMLADRIDIFPAYHVDVFRHELLRHAVIVKELVVSNAGRTLFEYQR